jgi:hypothetical protein
MKFEGLTKSMGNFTRLVRRAKRLLYRMTYYIPMTSTKLAVLGCAILVLLTLYIVSDNGPSYGILGYTTIYSSGTITPPSLAANLFPYGGDWAKAIADITSISGMPGWQNWIKVDYNVLYNGKPTLRIDPDPNHSADDGDAGCAWIGQQGIGHFNVKAGDSVFFSCWIKTGSGSTGWIGGDWKTANYAFLTNQYPYDPKTQGTVYPNSGWTYVHRHFGPCDSRAALIMGLLNNQLGYNTGTSYSSTTPVWFAEPILYIGPNV